MLASEEDNRLIPCLTLTDEDQNAAAAQYLVCSYLVRACREAMYELALDEESDPSVRRQAIQTLKVVHQDWVAAQKSIGSRYTGVGDSGPTMRSD
jgi:hypothetical protein